MKIRPISKVIMTKNDMLIVAVGLRMKRAAVLPMIFMVDRPFLFVIEHKPSKLLLFLGSVRKIESTHEKDEL